MKKTTQLLGILFLSATLTVACGKKAEETTTTDATENTVSEPQSTNELLLESTDQMSYNQKEFKVKAGEEVTLTLKHIGTMPKEVMGHNVVILKPGTDVAKFAEAAIGAKDTDYIPAEHKESVVAHSKVIGGGESDSVKVTLEKGTYDFICSFPGHVAQMKGVIIAE